MKKVMFLLLLLSFVFTPCLWADEVDNTWQAANSPVYGTKAGGMLGRGLLNAVTCFVDVVVHTVEGTKEGPPLVGTLTGLGSGIGCTVLRAGSGVLDILTFWVPGFNGFPVSRSYSNCLLTDEELTESKAQQEALPEPKMQPEDFAKPAKLKAEDYAKPAGTKKKYDSMDYVKK